MKIRMAVEQSNKDAFIEHVMRKYHFSAEEKSIMMQVYEKVRAHMAPYAAYRVNTRMRGIPLIDAEQSVLVAMTLGEGVDHLQEYYEKEHALLESYMVECVANELLLQMYSDFNLGYPKFHRRYVKRYVFVGDDIPLASMQGLLQEIYGRLPAEIGQENDVTANEYGVLLPSKSVVFFALLSEDPRQKCQGICLNCGNQECENRMQEQRQIHQRREPEEQQRTVEPEQQLNYGYQRIFGNVKER